MVGGAIGGVTPHPADVKGALFVGRRAAEIGIHFTVTFEQRPVDQAAPDLRVHVIDVEEPPPVATPAVAIVEDQGPLKNPWQPKNILVLTSSTGLVLRNMRLLSGLYSRLQINFSTRTTS